METIEVKPRSVRGALIPLTAMRRDVFLPAGKYTVNRAGFVYDPRCSGFCHVALLTDVAGPAAWVVPADLMP